MRCWDLMVRVIQSSKVKDRAKDHNLITSNVPLCGVVDVDLDDNLVKKPKVVSIRYKHVIEHMVFISRKLLFSAL